MSDDDLVETQTPVFTELEVYRIAGYLSEIWGIESPWIVQDTEEAIIAILNAKE